MKRLILSAAVCCIALTSAVSAQSIAGEWDASINTPGGVRSFKIVFQVSGDTLTGTVKREAGDVPLFGTVKGSAVSFSYTVNYNGNPLELTIIAMVTGDAMKGTVDFAGAAEDEFWAKRAGATRPPPAS